MVSSDSYIDGFSLNSLAEKGVHFFPVSNDINTAMKSFFKILFHADKIQSIDFTEHDDNIDIALLIGSAPRSGAEKPQPDDLVSVRVAFLEFR